MDYEEFKDISEESLYGDDGCDYILRARNVPFGKLTDKWKIKAFELWENFVRGRELDKCYEEDREWSLADSYIGTEEFADDIKNNNYAYGILANGREFIVVDTYELRYDPENDNC